MAAAANWTDEARRPLRNALALLLFFLLATFTSAANNDDSDLVFEDINDGPNSLDSGSVFPVASPLLQDDKRSVHHHHHLGRQLGQQQQQLELDDEDFAEGSGSGFSTPPPPPSPTQPPTPSPVYNVTTLSSKVTDDGTSLVHYRMTLNLINTPYEEDMSDRDSSVFNKLAQDLMNAIEPLYDTIPGTQMATVIKLDNSPPGVMVTVDLSSENFDEAILLERIILEELNRRRLGPHAVSPEGFTFRKMGGGTSDCEESQFTCRSGDCIPYEKYCDDEYDCPDGSDETEQCDPVCNDGEFACDRLCFENSKKCDGHQDCSDGSDEANCVHARCGHNQFECSNGQCINTTSRCDYRVDCPQGDDESFCPPCGNGEWRCLSGDYCISFSNYCDKKNDCPDQSDEYYCPGFPHACSTREWQCDDGSCIESQKRCNGRIDCRNDDSDERDCTCRHDQFSCSDGTCIAASLHCDGNIDCPDFSDERNCVKDSCQSAEFTCSNRQCIDQRLKCDGQYDCQDGSDEFDCDLLLQPPPKHMCRTTDFVCDQGKCLSPSVKCNRQYDCQDATDELICDQCGSYQYVCNDGVTCISWRDKCNGRQDCPHNEDEIDCEDTCSPSQVRCKDGFCIDKDKDCNGSPDCPDYSDEEECVICSPDSFRCTNGKCIDKRRRCDGWPDCSDRSDEECELPACGPGEFQCQDRSCIAAQLECNGRLDCSDGSDEEHCVKECKRGEFRCNDGTCIEESNRCNEFPDCRDYSDERNCDTCAQGFISCNDGSCIDARRRCDGREDCRDGSDERCVCLDGQFQCNDRTCINQDLQCDGKADCYDGTDEENCVTPKKCKDGQFECRYGDCIEAHLQCDGKYDCVDGADELNCNIGTSTGCSAGMFQCRDRTCIDARQRCDRRVDCRDRSDEIGCGCSSNEFRCSDGTCIDSRRKCDNYPDCPDYSDERDCRQCSSNEFQCSDGECVPLSAKCNNQQDCQDGGDEIGCRQDCLPHEFTCVNKECIDKTARCDGKFDCTDYSDEKECPPRGHVNLKTYPDHQIIHQSREVVFQCRDEGSQRSPVRWSRQNDLPLPAGTQQLQGRLTMPNIQPEDAGTYLCTAIGFPATQPGAQRSVYLQVTPYEPPTIPPPKVCEVGQSTCHNGQCIRTEFVCDDDFDCQDGSDEHNCARHDICEPNEFRCNNSKCILKYWLCDGDNDCLDKSDEINCVTPPPGSECRYDEFPCLSGNQCIPKSFLCDGEIDCQDRSDEVGCAPPEIVTLPPETITVSIGETVTLTCRAIGNPTPLINWRLNWGNVPPPPRVTITSENGLGQLIIRDVQASDQGAYTCEAISHKESILGRPDTQLIIRTIPPSSVCRPPQFNAAARTREECIGCFCFGVTDQCTSSNSFVSQLPPVTESSISAVTLSPDGTYSIQDPRYTIDQENVDYRPVNREFRIDNHIRQGHPRSVLYYWTMPIQFQGDKLSSYGGYLKYSILYRISQAPSPVSAANVIIKGNGISISYNGPDLPMPGSINKIEARFWEGEWIRLGTSDKPVRPGSSPTASREDIMMVLQNIEIFLIRAGYDENFAESSLLGLSIDTAVPQETGQPRATFVEQCSCPPGYTGMSCQSCAPGYSRVTTGQYLGECRRLVCNCHGHSERCSPHGVCESCQHNTEGSQCERCKPGSYGDARRGTPTDCQSCPCPLTSPSNQFSSTCYLDQDGQVTCDNCSPGYEGRRCERCSPGFKGDPFIPGDSCKRDVSDQCDPVGSTSLTPNPVTNLCQCKPFVTGPRCNQCQSSTFHLNPHSPGGCIHCFCMGITRNCESCKLRRSVVKSQFIDSPEGFSLTTMDRSQTFDRGLQIDPFSQSISYTSFYILPKGRTYYWSLPSQFIGDKITSYGGFLNYTITFSSTPSATPNTDPDVQIIGNRITLDYYHRQQFLPNVENAVSISMYEKYWRRTDGQPATREYLLMALADLDALLIKATYSSEITDSSIGQIDLETAEDRDTGGRPAYEVEQCSCPLGYKGLSCEDCDSGFTRSGGGLYLGVCEPCFCNGHSSDCDPESGACKNCQHNTEGDFCGTCKKGFKGDATQGTPYDCELGGPDEPCRCSIQGSLGLECDARQQCPCKNSVEGRNCNRCKEGTFHLESRNPEGCTKCFCFGITERCTSSSYYRSQVKLQVTGPRSHGVILTNVNRDLIISNNVNGNIARNEVSFRSFPSVNGDAETLYWALPDQFTGNKLTSYGGFLQYMQRYISRRDGDPYDDADVIIFGNGVSLSYFSRPPLQPDEGRNNEIELIESKWQQSDSQGLRPAIRANFLMVLANINAILIRASFNTKMIDSVLGEVSLDIAHPHSTGQELAYAVEQCSCPPGYTGLSCEECAPGYNRDPNAGPFLGKCTICNCHGHSKACEPNTGECLQCEHNTVGTSCQKCAQGFYGDATVGTPDDCKPCPCPLTVPSNQFSSTCFLDSDGRATCSACPAGYAGRNCEFCAPGYRGNPRSVGETCEQEGRPSITVRIEEPRSQRIQEGSTVTFRCSGVSQVSDVSYNIIWTKEGSVLPSQAQARDGLLTIPNVRQQDSGTYVCTGSDLYGESQDKATLLVTTTAVSSAPRVWIEPNYLQLRVGEPAQFHCHAEGSPKPYLQWTGGQNNVLNPLSTFHDGVFRIPSVRKSDEAEYHCTATNIAGSDSMRTIIYVSGVDPDPEPEEVSINPQSQSSRIGDTVQFHCESRVQYPDAYVSWSRSGANLPSTARQERGTLTLSNIDDSFRGVYICTIKSNSGTFRGQATLDVITVGIGSPPTAKLDPQQQTISQGSTVELNCIITGEPSPIVKWSKYREELGPNHQVIERVLKIVNAQIQDRGVYICEAENSEGIARASTIVEVERRELPGIEIYPGTTQTISRGGSAHFQCRVISGIPSPKVTWTRVDHRPLSRSAEILSGGTVIRFNRVIGDEAGQYMCTAENDAGFVSSVATLTIQGFPIVRISPASPYTVSVEQHVHLECRAEGEPTPSVSWKPPIKSDSYGYPIESRIPFPRETPGISILEINKVQREDAGVYICSARNAAGVTEERLELIVEGSSKSVPGLETDHKDFVVPEGSKAEMTCFVSGGDHALVLTLNWVRSDNRPLPSGHTVREGTLIIENARKEDAGEYTCLAIENGVIVFTVEQRLRVIAPPQIKLHPMRQTAQPGDFVEIQCTAQGDQPIDIEWTRVGNNLGSNVIRSGGILQFRRIGIADAGRYLCTAVNPAGRAEGVAEVLVNERGCDQVICDNGHTNALCEPGSDCGQVPADCADSQYPCSEEPVIKIPNREMNVYIGSTVDLLCEVKGAPLPKVRWSKESGELPIGSREVDTKLRISGVRVEDGGRYYCTATNDAGSTRDSVILHVTGLTPVSVHIRPTVNNVKIGDSLDVHCEVSGDSSALISWSRLGEALSSNTQTSGKILRFTNVKSENGGVYRCQVDTSSGTFTDDYTLVIQDIPSRSHNREVETRTAPYGSTVSMDCRSTLSPPVDYKWTKQGGLLPADATVRGTTLTIPDVRAEDAGTYVCTVHGADEVIDIPTVLLVTGVVPYFAQAPVSFMALPTLRDAYLVFDIQISFKPESPEGLILYNGQKSGGSGDFLSFGLSQGYADFRFDVGAGPAILRSEKPLEIGQWHTVHLHRNKKEGMMRVDGHVPVNGTANGRFQGLDLEEPLYIGGVPDFYTIHRENGFSQGFVGCISRLIISGISHQLIRDAQITSGVTSCETCAVNPCINGGLCQESHTKAGYVCICPPGFSGEVCEKIGEACYPGICGTGRCINKPEGGFDCYCHFGKAGLRCENDIKIQDPSFSNDAYVAYPTPNARAQKHLKIATRFKPRDLKDGIILYCSQNEEGHGDFISLTIKDGHLEFRFDTGSGPAVLQSKEELQADQWVQIVAERSFRDGTLIVNNGDEVKGKSPGVTRGLDLRLPLYVGGYDKHKVKVSPFVEVDEGFDGCVSHMEVSGVEIDLINSVIDAANVDDCGGQTPCDRRPCVNGGLCREFGPKPTDYECICQQGFKGRNCEIEEDLCIVIQPCMNDGICIGTGTSYKCNCPLGYRGEICEKNAEFSKDVSFQGSGYLELPLDLMPHSSSTINEIITLEFKTLEANGLILWHGQKPETDGKGLDYISLSVESGYLVYSYELGSGPASIRSPVRVDDGIRHKVVLKRLGRDGSMELDSVHSAVGETQGVLQMLNTEGNIYIGGLPNAEFMTANKHNLGFNGCIYNLQIQDSGVLNLQRIAIRGYNAVACEHDSDNSSYEQIDNQIHQ